MSGDNMWWLAEWKSVCLCVYIEQLWEEVRSSWIWEKSVHRYTAYYSNFYVVLRHFNLKKNQITLFICLKICTGMPFYLELGHSSEWPTKPNMI